jgi:hypothetical protein
VSSIILLKLDFYLLDFIIKCTILNSTEENTRLQARWTLALRLSEVTDCELSTSYELSESD